MPYSYPEDYDDLMDEPMPYQGIGREGQVPLEDPSGVQKIAPPVAAAPINPVKAAIAKRQGMAIPDYSDDPLMKDYNQREQQLDEYRALQNKANLYSNLGQAGSRMAMGASTPSSDNALYNNMARQNEGIMKSREEDMDRRQRIVNAIEQRKSREAVAANTNAYRNLGLQMRQAAQDAQTKRVEGMNIGRANTLLHNTNLSREENKLNASRSAQSIIDAIKNGELKDSKNVRTQLTNLMATIEMGSPGGEADRQAMGINNLYTKLKDAASFLDSNPQSTIPPEYLTQLETESHALGDRAAKNYTVMANSALAGADLSGGNPDVDPGQVHKLAKQRIGKFLSDNGYDPETGMPLKERASQGGGSGGLIPSAYADTPQTKTLGGKVYIKVPGGWKLQR